MRIGRSRYLFGVLAAFGLAGAFHAVANPVTVSYVDVPSQCADPANVALTEEVGATPPFSAEERITYTVAAAAAGDCSIAPGGGDDYEVTATNMSGLALVDVFVVADTGTDFGNWDGNIAGSHAKKIADVWANGGVITFRLMNVAPNVPPNFDSLGVNSPSGPSNFSIVARRVGFDGGCNDVKADAPPCDETTPSLGKYRIYISPKFRPNFAGCPAYQNTICGSSAFRLESPNLFDSATLIGRSAPHLHGSAADTGGTPVGDSGTLVKDSDFTVPPPWLQGPNGSREIHTEIVGMSLTGGGASVRGGLSAPTRPKSFGEVESQSASGLPANDFPADSFFDVFVEVDLPICGSFPGGTVYNQQALLVVNTNVGDLPPQVVYIHGNSSFVPVYFKFASTGSPPVPWGAGNLLGWLSLAGHGVGEGGASQLEQLYCAATEMTGIGGCCLPAPFGTCEILDSQGCADIGGQYAGDGNPCKCGACCLPANGCVWPVLETECHAMANGHFLGHGSTLSSCAHDGNGNCTSVGACCLPNNGCELVTEDECIKLHGRWEGAGTTACHHDAAGDCIPTVSEWGLVVMAVLVLTAATVVIMRRRAMVRGGS